MKQSENQLGIQGHSCNFVPNKVRIFKHASCEHENRISSEVHAPILSDYNQGGRGWGMPGSR